MDAAKVEAIKNRYGGPMSPSEIEMLRDVQGFIDFAIRNGLSYPAVVGVLLHDMDEIARSGSRLEDALKRTFVPQVSGYSRYSDEWVGQPEEDESE